MYKNVHKSVLCNKNVEAVYPSIGNIGKYIHTMEYYAVVKNKQPSTNMDEPYKCDVWKRATCGRIDIV